MEAFPSNVGWKQTDNATENLPTPQEKTRLFGKQAKHLSIFRLAVTGNRPAA